MSAEVPRILPIWQPVGNSTHLIARTIAQKYNVKTSHTGTLDPMAEGVVIILLGEERFKKYEYAKWLKTYEFEIVFGIQTDTYDGMGIITNTFDIGILEEALVKTLHSFKGSYRQIVPIYSTLKVKGKHLHEHARAHSLVKNLPTRSGEIKDIELLDFYTLPLSTIKKSIVNRIQIVKGDFRQKAIIDQWQNFNAQPQFQVARIKVNLTKGLYVRSLSQDLAASLKSCGFTYSISRTSNGSYTKEDCVLI